MLDCRSWIARPEMNPSAIGPRARQVGIQCQGAVDLLACEGEVAQNIGDREGSMAKRNRIVAADANCAGDKPSDFGLVARVVVEDSPALAVGQAGEQPPQRRRMFRVKLQGTPEQTNRLVEVLPGEGLQQRNTPQVA